MSLPLFLILSAVLAFAVAGDIHQRRIPNRLVLVASALGLGASLLPDGIGLAQAAGGMALGFALLLPLYLLGTMGAGDVKLMAALGSFLGIQGSLGAALMALIAGGVLALTAALLTRNLGRAAGHVHQYLNACAVWLMAPASGQKPVLQTSAPRLPYSIAIACGVLAYLATQFDFQALRG